MARVTLSSEKIKGAAAKALKQTAVLLGRTFTQVISEPGAFPSTPNDIVDLGQLRSSQMIEFSQDGGTVIYSWNTEYALYVHEGYTLRNGRYIEGRPWTTEGLKRVNIESMFAKFMKTEL